MAGFDSVAKECLKMPSAEGIVQVTTGSSPLRSHETGAEERSVPQADKVPDHGGL